MNFNQVMQTEDAMKITFICLFVNVCKFMLWIASKKIGVFNCPIKEIPYFTFEIGG